MRREAAEHAEPRPSEVETGGAPEDAGIGSEDDRASTTSLQGHDDQEPGAPDLRAIEVTEPLHEVADAAMDALVRRNREGGDPELYVQGNVLTRVVADSGDGQRRLDSLMVPSLRERLSRVAIWTRRTKGGIGLAHPPKDVAEVLLARGEYPDLPPLERVVTVPVIARDGTLDARPGYVAAARVYYDEPDDLRGLRSRLAVEDPLTMRQLVAWPQVEWARDLLLGELLGEFPYVTAADRAHALALTLEPFVRGLIDGPTPLHVVEAPTAGTGKSLLTQAALVPAHGLVPFAAQPRTDEEWRKALTTYVKNAQPAVIFDNLAGEINSSALAQALTTAIWQDRLLGSNKDVRAPIRTTWAATMNNAQLSFDLTRRSVRTRLDAELERPWEGRTFRHPDLLRWALNHRGELIVAALTLVRWWLVHGVDPEDGELHWEALPQGEAMSGSHVAWSRVVGGVLACAGIEGFLANREELWEDSDPETAEWRAFLEAWFVMGAEPLTTRDLVDRLNVTPDLMRSLPTSVQGGHPDQLTRRLGYALRERKDRVFGRYVLRRVEGRRWLVADNT